MTVESILFDTLKGIVGNRAFPDSAPLSTQKPFITYQQIGGEVIKPLTGGLPDKENARMQINVWAESRLSASLTSKLVRDALRLSTAFNVQQEGAAISEYDEEMKIYGSQQDFSIWYAA